MIDRSGVFQARSGVQIEGWNSPLWRSTITHTCSSDCCGTPSC